MAIERPFQPNRELTSNSTQPFDRSVFNLNPLQPLNSSAGMGLSGSTIQINAKPNSMHFDLETPKSKDGKRSLDIDWDIRGAGTRNMRQFQKTLNQFRRMIATLGRGDQQPYQRNVSTRLLPADDLQADRSLDSQRMRTLAKGQSVDRPWKIQQMVQANSSDGNSTSPSIKFVAKPNSMHLDLAMPQSPDGSRPLNVNLDLQGRGTQNPALFAQVMQGFNNWLASFLQQGGQSIAANSPTNITNAFAVPIASQAQLGNNPGTAVTAPLGQMQIGTVPPSAQNHLAGTSLTANLALAANSNAATAKPLVSVIEPNFSAKHGTEITQTVAGTNNPLPIQLNSGQGGWAASVNRVLDSAKGTNQRPIVFNLSSAPTWNNPKDGSFAPRYQVSQPEIATAQRIQNEGALAVVAAGNDGKQMSPWFQLSREYDSILTVGAGDQKGRSPDSSLGVDLIAPGDKRPGGEVGGTSIATARVTEVASQVLAANPVLTGREVAYVLKSTATDLKTPGWDSETGYGLLNREAAIRRAKELIPQSNGNQRQLITAISNSRLIQ